MAEALLFHCKQRGQHARVSQVPSPVGARAPLRSLNRQVSNADGDSGLAGMTHSLEEPGMHLSWKLTVSQIVLIGTLTECSLG